MGPEIGEKLRHFAALVESGVVAPIEMVAIKPR